MRAYRITVCPHYNVPHYNVDSVTIKQSIMAHKMLTVREENYCYINEYFNIFYDDKKLKRGVQSSRIFKMLKLKANSGTLDHCIRSLQIARSS